jgi:hypothetical protein
MIDIETNRRLEISTEGDVGPYLMVPLDQLADVKTVLDRGAISYAIAEDAIEVDGEQAIAIIDFDLSADPTRIQALLDAA